MFVGISHLDNISSPLFADFLMSGIFHRTHGIAVQGIFLGVNALVLGPSLCFPGVNLARLGSPNLLVRLLLGLRRLAAGVGCGHFDGLEWVMGSYLFGIGESVICIRAVSEVVLVWSAQGFER